MAKDKVRICKKCGTQWRLSSRLARERAPGQMEMLGRKLEASGSSMTIGSRQRAADQLRLANAEAKKARVLSAAQCPGCGSSKFREYPDGWSNRRNVEKAVDKGNRKAQRSRGAMSGPVATGSIVVPPPPPGTGAQWLGDPSGGHELRWWNGTAWTDQVSDSGVTGSDPLGSS